MTTLPPKYIKVDGVMQMNPAYFAAQRDAQPSAPPLSLYPMMSISPVLCDMTQVNEYRTQFGGDLPLSAATSATLDILQNDAEIAGAVGVDSEHLISELGAVFKKFDAPIGLMNKLMGLQQQFDEIEFIMDDSGSMATATGHGQTRWTEAQLRLKEMLEFLVHVPVPPIKVSFLNRRAVLSLKRKDKTPSAFLRSAYRKIDAEFLHGPSGGTPIFNCLSESLDRGRGKRIARFLFCDGEPNGGKSERAKIWTLTCERNSPADNPIALMSCSERDSEVEWMKELEEVAPFCSEFDDFVSEAREVHLDQGNVFPYTKGFYMICQLVGTINPDDLDAMDESVPFTKWTLDNFLGVESSSSEFRRYFDGFKTAQAARRAHSALDRLKKEFSWEPIYEELLVQRTAAAIPRVVEFKRQLAKVAKKGKK
jgi:hypothetical protein